MTASVLLTQKDGLKDYANIKKPDAWVDILLDAFIAAASEWIEDDCGRKFLSGSHTDVMSVDPGQTVFTVEHWPINSVTSVKSATDWDFASASEVSTGDRDIDLERGKLRFKQGVLAPGPRSLEVVYNGGLAADAAGIETGHPTLALACRQICEGMWRRRHKLESESENFQGHTITRKDLDVPRIVKVMISPYRTAAL